MAKAQRLDTRDTSALQDDKPLTTQRMKWVDDLSSTLADLGSVGEGIFHALPDMARNFDTVSARP